MKDVKINFKKVDDRFVIERKIINTVSLNEYTTCSWCPFYNPPICYGDYGSCSIYDYVDRCSGLYDDIVYDKTKCKVFEYLNSKE